MLDHRGLQDRRTRATAGARSALAGTAGAEAAAGSALPAIGTICLGILFLCTNDAVAKWLTEYYAPLQLVFMRNLIALPLVALLAVGLRGKGVLYTRHTRLHALRGALVVAAAVAFFTGLTLLPLAEATALVFAAPLFITALSVPLLGEHVGWRRWAACLVGFTGVLVIVQPGGETFQTASLLPLGTAVLYALLMLSARRIGSAESVWTLMVQVTFWPLLFSALVLPFVWETPRPEHLLGFAALALCGTLGMTLITQAFRMAPAAVVAPFDYTALLWATVFGFVLWGEVPGAWTYVGAGIIIMSGIYILFRERRRR
ncbi:DMT family transporter [Lutibaculum baratangense]|uniref:EamA domain-containing protein n=1 Tax=Lutibaculum baratangense AMV1 TaxID=631454 RepID=V4REJ2_9HYPH|nr:DMT family transporter [Lutibaculum baratangense]ESR24556.1 hypothetical protein N177_2390 [Lutibaculum baratangense AMV1]